MASESIYAPKNIKQPALDNDPKSQNVDGSTPRPHPFLTRPVLYISNIEASLSDRDLANGIFNPFVPVRLSIDRGSPPYENKRVKGTVEFQTLERAEQAYATITIPRLSFNEDADVDAKPSAKPRLVKQLPLEIEDVEIFDIFRPYGPIASAQRITTNSQGRHTGFRGTALVTFYDEKDAQRAQDDLHCAEVEGNTISVSIDTVSTRPAQSMPSFSASATPFVPSMPSSSSSSHHLNATAPTFQPLRPDSYSSSSPPLFQSHQMDKPSLSLPGNAAHIDPCNLFCKNLDPGIDSTDLSTIFRPFGSIISARVMRDERGVSKGFGFVSFSKAEEASLAMQAMDKSVHGNKQMIVRLHEPKRIRQEKLSQQYGSTHTGSSGVEPLDTPSEGLVDSEESSSSFDGESPRISAEESERQRLEEAVSLVLPPHDPTEEIIDLLMGLPSKERAMSLFNQDYLRRKVEEAKDILAIEDDNETTSDQAAPAQLTKENIELATASPQIGTESKSVSDNIKATYTLTELAALPAVEIIRMANSSARSSTPLPKANPAIAKETDVFIDGIQDLSLTDQKQKLGDQLFKKIKSFGVKGAPKITIALLDSEDLRSLAHLMNSYPDCLREKVISRINK